MAKNKNPVKEVAVFGIGLGLFLGIAAYFALTGLKDSPDLWGMKRTIAIGMPVAAIASLFLFSGVSLAVTKAKWAVVCSILGAFIAAGYYFLFEISTIGFFGGRLVSAIVYALPILLIIRGRAAMSYLEQSGKSQPCAPTDAQ